MTHVLIPREPSTALLRPFTGCPEDELPLAWAAMVRIAEVQHARAGSQSLAQIEEPAQPVAGYRISDPSDPELGFWFSETPCAEGYTSEPLYAGAAPAAVAPRGEYPQLPEAAVWSVAGEDGMPTLGKGWMFSPVQQGNAKLPLFTAQQMWAYHDLGRQSAHKAPALEAPAAPADGATPGPWFVRKREVNGELRDCFVAAPDCQGLAYDACILCDDEYHDGVGRKLADCELIVAAVNQHRAALAAAPQAPAVPVAVTTRAELEKLQGGAGSMATIFPADASGFPVRLYAEPAAPAVDAALNALIADVRALPTLRASEIDGEESDGTPKHWRNRPFVSLRKLELLLRDRVTASSDTALLNFIAAEYLDLRSFGMPTGQGDADVGWRVIQHHMGEPTERVVAEVYKDDPRSAIRAAIARLERDPYCTGALHEEDAAQAREGGAA